MKKKGSILKYVYTAALVLFLVLLFVDRWVYDPSFIVKLANILIKIENFGPWSLAIILAILMGINLLKELISVIWKFIWKHAIAEYKFVLTLILAGIIFFVLKFSAPILREYANYADEYFFNPVILEKNKQMTEEQLLEILLYKESQNVADSEKHRKIQEATQRVCDSIGIKRVDLEFACFTEDIGDPFVISKVIPTRATGKIQLTGVGLGNNTRYNGKILTMDDVRFAAETKNVDLLNSAMEQYILRFWKAQGRPRLSSALHFKMLLFAPGYMYKMDSGQDFVIYSKYSEKPANYYQNEPLDGWCVESGRIVKNPAKKNGSIELSEVYYSMEYTKGALAREFTRK